MRRGYLCLLASISLILTGSLTTGAYASGLSVLAGWESDRCVQSSSDPEIIPHNLYLPPGPAGPDVNVCSGSTLQLGIDDIPGFNYQWIPVAPASIAMLSDSSSGMPFFHVPFESSTIKYDWVLRVDDGVSIISDTVTIRAFAGLSVTANPDTAICTGEVYALGGTVVSGAAVSWSWQPASGLSSDTIPNPLASPDTSTHYTGIAITSDGCADTVQVAVEVAPALVLNITPDQFICQGQIAVLNASGADTYRWSPSGDLSDSLSAMVLATPSVTTLYTVIGSDAFGCSDTASMTLTVNPIPSVGISADTTICPETSVALFATGGDSYIWSPASGLDDDYGPAPTATPSVPTSYTVTVTDVNGCVNTALVSIQFEDAPGAGNDLFSLPPDSALSGLNVLWNDSAGVSVVVLAGPAHSSSWSLSSDGHLNYEPDSGFYGMDSIAYLICDSVCSSLCDSAWIYVSVTPAELPAIDAMDDHDSTDAEVAIAIAVLDNDLIVSPLNMSSFALSVAPEHGDSFVDTISGRISYLPESDFCGLDSFRYRICAQDASCDEAWVYITVQCLPAAIPPAAHDDAAITEAGVGTQISVLANDDPGSAPIDSSSLSIVQSASNGIAAVEGNGLTYMPRNGWCGQDSLSYQICDVEGLCDSAWVWIEVLCPSFNANDDFARTEDNASINIDILLNDDAGADPSCLILLDDPQQGSAELDEGQLTYTPLSGFVGTDCFRYEVCDLISGQRDSALVCIEVFEKPEVYVPDVFTPNGDGINETLVITGLEEWPRNELIIYNRWENVVYSSQSYGNDWAGEWMGNSQPLPNSTYWYILILDSQDPDSPRLIGHTSIYRGGNRK